MNVLVTGAFGFIGSNVVKLLEEKGARVWALDDFTSSNWANLEGFKGQVVAGDVCDEKLFNGLPKFDAVIHEGAITDTTLKDDKRMIFVNFKGFKNILDFCLRKKIKKLVYASSAGVYGDGPSPMKEEQQARPLNSYAYSKHLCDRYLLANVKGLQKLMTIVGLRYFNVYGPGEYHKKNAASMIYQLYLQMKADKNPRVFKHGEQKRDFIYVKDVAEITGKAMELKKCVIMNVGTGKARSFNDIIDALNSVLKKNLEPDYFDNPYKGLYQDFTEADIARLKKNLKFQPRFSLEKGIRDYVENHLSL